MRLVYIGLLFCSLLGCQQVVDHEWEPSPDQSVINGESQARRRTKAGKAIVLVELLDARRRPVSFCTGALIGPRTVLTAAHCFDVRKNPEIRHFRIVFDSIYQKKRPLRFINGHAYSAHPSFNSQTVTGLVIRKDPERPRKLIPVAGQVPAIDHDIAVAVMVSPAPPDFISLPVDQSFEADYSGEITEFYGYGRSRDYSGRFDEDVIKSAGTLRRGEVRVRNDYRSLPDRFYVERTEKLQSLCQGDSGGPHLLRDQLGQVKIIGVSSGTLGRRLKYGKISCEETGQIAKVSSFYEWIKDEESRLLTNLKWDRR